MRKAGKDSTALIYLLGAAAFFLLFLFSCGIIALLYFGSSPPILAGPGGANNTPDGSPNGTGGIGPGGGIGLNTSETNISSEDMSLWTSINTDNVQQACLQKAKPTRLQPLEALKMSDATVAAWEEFLRLDASNVVSLFNLGVARFGRSNALLEQGRVGEAAATLREMTRRYESATPSLFLNDQISFANTRLANVEASRGNARAAEEAMRRGDAARDWQVKNSPAGSWRAQSRPLYNPFTQALVAGQLGDDRRVLELGRDLAPKLAALTATDQGSTLEKANTRRSLSVLMALAAYRLGDYAAAELATTVALEHWRVLRPDELGERRDEASDRALRALVLVRLGRQDEARALAGHVLALQRGLASKNQGSAGQRFELAQALIAASASGLGDAQSSSPRPTYGLGRLRRSSTSLEPEYKV